MQQYSTASPRRSGGSAKRLSHRRIVSARLNSLHHKKERAKRKVEKREGRQAGQAAAGASDDRTDAPLSTPLS
jgi:hypothetical protein